MSAITEQKLAGKVALVTGGSRGIGAAIAKRLAGDGAAIAFTYSSSGSKSQEVAKAIEAKDGKAVGIQADSADPEAVRNAVIETVKALGRLDILVNNAGIAVMNPLQDFKLEDFDRMVAINVRAVFVAAQEAARHMTEGGRIITIGSTIADRVPFPGAGVYAMTKAAVAGLTRGLSRDLGSMGITINNVQPGPVATDMNPPEGDLAETLKGFMAIKRYAKVDEIADLVAYLASPESAFITGASLTIDGGFAA